MSEKQPCEKPVPSSSHLLLKVAAFLATPDFPKSQSCRGPWWGPWKGGFLEDRQPEPPYCAS